MALLTMRQLCLFCRALVFVLACYGAWAQESLAPATLPELQRRLEALVAQPKYAAAFWGVKIVSADTGKTLFEHNPGKFFTPASNCKLFTVALALDRLAPDYRIKTSVYAASPPDAQGVVAGDLVVYGRGDPTITARRHQGNIFAALEPLVAGLTNAGVKRVLGDLVGDSSYFHGPHYGSGWAWDDLEYYYGAVVSALSINDNTLAISAKPGPAVGAPGRLSCSLETDLLTLSNRTRTVPADRNGSLTLFRPLEQNVVYVSGQIPLESPGLTELATVPAPAELFVALLKEALVRHGVEVRGRLRTVNWLDRQTAPLDCAGMAELASVQSPTMGELAREVQKPSQNLYADLLLAQVGERARASRPTEDQTSEELGIEELNRFLAKAGVPEGEVLFEEGSGLSRDNLATPNATVALLLFMTRHPCGQIFQQALPIAGVDGTLRNRMKETPAAGNVRAKTGSLHWANSLSGYVTSAAGEHLVFSLMLNRYHPPPGSGSAREDLDRIAVLLAGFMGRSE